MGGAENGYLVRPTNISTAPISSLVATAYSRLIKKGPLRRTLDSTNRETMVAAKKICEIGMADSQASASLWNGLRRDKSFAPPHPPPPPPSRMGFGRALGM